MVLRIDVLGEVRAVVGDRVVELGHQRQVCVLVALVVEPGRAVPVDRLVDRVWGDDPPRSARRTLASYVTRLRQVVPDLTITHRAGGYACDLDPAAIDLHRFTRLVAKARTTVDETAGALYAQALDLWRGEPFTGLDVPWLVELRRDLADVRLAAQIDHADVVLRLGGHAGLLPELAARAARHPLDERIAAQLIRALYRDGRTAAALDAFGRTRTALRDELGTDPGAELRELHRRLLSDSPVPRQLPAPPRVLTGRQAELAALDAAVGDAVTVISGIGGVGKTALALSWAHRNAGRFPDGVLHADLRGFEPSGRPTPPGTALRGFLHALDVPAERMPGDVDAQAALYRTLTADRHMLVLLDNARDTAQVQPLLPGGERCAVLVTSRNRLGGLAATHAVRAVALDVLEPDQAHALFTTRLGASRVDAEPDAAADLLRWCAGLPLAIGIVAARAAAQPNATLASLAEESGLDTLDAGEPNAALRTVFSWSYGALPPDAAVLFGLLGLVPGPDVPLEAAAAMADLPVPRTRSLLGVLEAAHLVAQHVPGRYRMHDLVRLYAAEQGRERDPAALGRLESWYLHSADRAATRLYPIKTRLSVGESCGPIADIPDELSGQRWLEAERNNLIAITAAARGWAASRLADVLRGFFWHRMDATGWRTTAEGGLAAAIACGDDEGQAAALLSLADLRFKLSDHDGAVRYYSRSLEIAGRFGWIRIEAAARSNLAGVHWRRGKPALAADQLMRARDLHARSDNEGGTTTAIANLAIVLRELGRLDEAFELHGQALELDLRLGGQSSMSVTLGEIGQTLHTMGRPVEALSHLERARELMDLTGHRSGLSDVLRNLAAVHLDLGRPAEADRLAREALAEAFETHDRQHQANAHNVLGRVDAVRGDRPAARRHHRTALDLAMSARVRYAAVEGLLGLAVVADDPAEARDHAARAAAMARESDYRLLVDRAAQLLDHEHAVADHPIEGP
ncbi:BTAD domain-containing putative transcriptional regulator [Saccharothrix violaceirubra]|uniref:DNA-binding SARP family transcriptional activator/tetratricopeptide (TPR) repeat protein n=1 Tax=Saccharothrix violaceirubra TaxID=413306 RepID=A0A7W7T5Z5_9PSEU|nr:AfsR/SARP family transcriptional regulator [Saccharothrix violaceirubra]MBB4967209.1 DNA-binding SARP family transcriptional activator/tetratricopeptide (TPR) repeat protein [Saccharothrix violaceirubra]